MSENLRVKVAKKIVPKCLVKFSPPGHFHLGLVVCEVLILEGLLTLLSIQDSIKFNLRHSGTSLRENYSPYLWVSLDPLRAKTLNNITAAVPADKIYNF